MDSQEKFHFKKQARIKQYDGINKRRAGKVYTSSTKRANPISNPASDCVRQVFTVYLINNKELLSACGLL